MSDRSAAIKTLLPFIPSLLFLSQLQTDNIIKLDANLLLQTITITISGLSAPTNLQRGSIIHSAKHLATIFTKSRPLLILLPPFGNPAISNSITPINCSFQEKQKTTLRRFSRKTHSRKFGDKVFFTDDSFAYLRGFKAYLIDENSLAQMFSFLKFMSVLPLVTSFRTIFGTSLRTRTVEMITWTIPIRFVWQKKQHVETSSQKLKGCGSSEFARFKQARKLQATLPSPKL